MKTQTQHYFGGCPECGECDDMLNIHRDHYAICRRHRTKWNFGANLFSSWREETETDWQRNAQELSGYHEVTPMPWRPTLRERLNQWRCTWRSRVRHWLLGKPKSNAEGEYGKIPF